MKRASNAPLENMITTSSSLSKLQGDTHPLQREKDFIKEKGFKSLDDFFRSDIVIKGWPRTLQTS